MLRTTVTTRGLVASTAPIPKYKGHSLPSEAIYDIAQKIREGRFPLGIEHTRKHQINYKVHSVEVGKTEDGYLGVWVEIEVDDAGQEIIGDKRAFSVSVTELFRSPCFCSYKRDPLCA